MAPNTGGSDASQRRRRILGSPVEPHSFYKSLREAESGSMTKDKFSKYSPLPDISRPHGRPLLRQKTYDVLEPVYVKGPPTPRHPARGKPPPKTNERGRTATVASRVANKDNHVAKDSNAAKDNHVAKESNALKNNHTPKDSHGAKESLPPVKDNSNPPSNRRATKLPHIGPPASHTATPASHIDVPAPPAAPAKRLPLRRTSHFRPQELSKDILPQSPTAFWFPI